MKKWIALFPSWQRSQGWSDGPCCLCGGSKWVPSTHVTWLITGFNSSSGEPDTLFWLLKALHTDAHTHTRKKNPFVPLCLQRGLGFTRGLMTTFIASSTRPHTVGAPSLPGPQRWHRFTHLNFLVCFSKTDQWYNIKQWVHLSPWPVVFEECLNWGLSHAFPGKHSQ